MASRAMRKMLMNGEHLVLGFDSEKAYRDRDQDMLERQQVLEEMTRTMADSRSLR